MSEAVNHPTHYSKGGRKECIEEMRDRYGDRVVAIFCLTNAYKYLYRAGEKEENTEEQDIAKARWYLNYVEKHMGAAVWDYSKYVIRLYRYIKEELASYVKC